MADENRLNCTIIGLNYAPEPTGIAPYTTSLARRLAQEGHHIRVITGYPHYPQWRIYDGFDGASRRDIDEHVDVLRYWHYVPRRPSFLRRSIMELAFGLRAVFAPWGDADVVLVVSPALLSSALVLARARLTRKPVITWIQDIYTVGIEEAGSARRLAPLLRAVEGSVIRSSERVVAIHDRFKHAMITRFRAQPERVDVIRNWTHVGSAFERDESVRTAHGWARNDVVVLHAGNMGAKQGLENVVAASRVAAERGSRVRFVLLGDGNQRAALESMGTNPNLQFIDPLPGGMFERTLASADILLVNERPGLTDMSVPSKLTSYLSTGLPVVGAVDASSITSDELAAAGCPRVDPEDPAALLRLVERIAGDPDEAARIGSSGQEFCASRLTEAAAVAAFRATIAAAAHGRAPHDTSIAANSTPGKETDWVHSQT